MFYFNKIKNKNSYECGFTECKLKILNKLDKLSYIAEPPMDYNDKIKLDLTS